MDGLGGTTGAGRESAAAGPARPGEESILVAEPEASEAGEVTAAGDEAGDVPPVVVASAGRGNAECRADKE